MPSLILYLADSDVEMLRESINADARLAWIVKLGVVGAISHWRAVERLDAVVDQSYSIWSANDGALEIPDGHGGVERVNAFDGWSAPHADPLATAPWFADALPGPYTLAVRRMGREHRDGIGRSDLSWAANRYASIGKPAGLEALAGWRRLRRFVRKHSVALPWPFRAPAPRFKAFAFPEAFRDIERGRPVDENP